MMKNRNLLKNLVLRDLKYRYAGSAGGVLWSVIHPIVLLISYSFVFKIVFRLKTDPSLGVDNFPLFLFCGMLPWLLFSDTIMRSCTSITDNTQLISKTIIPAEILPLAITISNFIQHAIALTVLLAVLLIFFQLHASVFFLLVYMPIVLLFAQGLGWIVAGLQVFLRDTTQALQIIMQFWFWFTPVFWARESLGGRFQGLLHWNPMALIVTGYRNSLLNLKQPSPTDVLIVFLLSTAVFAAGAVLFRHAKPAFPDVL